MAATLTSVTSAITLIVLAALVRTLYRLALPSPIPGIPHNVASAGRLLGDIPTLLALKKAGKRQRNFWVRLCQSENAPVTQFFMGPFSRPGVVVCDYREARDLLTRRAKDLDRGAFNVNIWSGVIPHHFVAMNSKDEQFNAVRKLQRDLMTPSFLRHFSAPSSYRHTLHLVQLWRYKAYKAAGRPFAAMDDLNLFTGDVIFAAALGIDEAESSIVQYLKHLQATSDSADETAAGADTTRKDATYSFSRFSPGPLLQSILTLGDAVGGSATAPSQKLYWTFTNLLPSTRAAQRTRHAIIQRSIDKAATRMALHPGDAAPVRFDAAVDYMVAREVAAAGKEGRAVTCDTPRFHDLLYGYCLGGQDTTHSALSFLVKRLGAHQAAQRRLRACLRAAYPEALAEARDPQPDEMDGGRRAVPYLDAFIEEVLRTGSPAPVVIKEAQCDLVVLGHVIPKGTNIFFPMWGPSLTTPAFPVDEDVRSETSQKHIGEVPSDWTGCGFPPSEFHPERWLRSTEDGDVVFDAKAGPFLTFGLGGRECWGKRLAYMQLRLVTTLLVWNFEFRPMPDELADEDIVDSLNAKPKSCYVRLNSF
ncbi:hypothetical protein PWT90_02935 [Aphanocladium album]|nr:hypothetical protein PWT90_02935 [Aphanocladium album]